VVRRIIVWKSGYRRLLESGTRKPGPKVWEVRGATTPGQPCRSPATKKGRCRLHGGAKGGHPPGKRNSQYRHGERTKAAIAEQRKFGALLEKLCTGLT
jgi:hypothetical protein